MEWQNWNSSSPSANNVKKLPFPAKAALTQYRSTFSGNYGILVLARLSVSTISPCIWMRNILFSERYADAVDPVNGIVPARFHWGKDISISRLSNRRSMAPTQAAFGEPGS